MTPQPIVIGLSLCDQIIVDQQSKKPSLIGVFTAIDVDGFPSSPQRFSAFAALTDGSGDGTIQLVANRDETNEEVYAQRGIVSFPERTSVVNAIFRVNRIRFPAPGLYWFSLLVDGDLLAQRRLQVDSAGGRR